MAESSYVMEDGSELDGATITLEPDLSLNSDLAQKMLVGKIITNKTLNKTAVKQTLTKSWEAFQGPQIGDLSLNTFMFTFSSASEVNKVMEDGSWNIMGNLLSLQFWDPQKALPEVRFSLVPFWTQFHDLPMEFMSVPNVQKLASGVGSPLQIENPKVKRCFLRPFFRARVLLNVDLPLVTGFWVPRSNLPKAWVSAKYEKLQGLCFKCGQIGHGQTTRKKNKVMSITNPTVPRYSHALSVPPSKSLANLEESSKAKRTGERSSPQSAMNRDISRERDGAQIWRSIMGSDETQRNLGINNELRGEEPEGREAQNRNPPSPLFRETTTVPLDASHREDSSPPHEEPAYEADRDVVLPLSLIHRLSPLPTTPVLTMIPRSQTQQLAPDCDPQEPTPPASQTNHPSFDFEWPRPDPSFEPDHEIESFGESDEFESPFAVFLTEEKKQRSRIKCRKINKDLGIYGWRKKAEEIARRRARRCHFSAQPLMSEHQFEQPHSEDNEQEYYVSFPPDDGWQGTAITTTVFTAAAVTDWLDGFIARKMKLKSTFCAFLDPVADKLMVASTLVLLCTRPLKVALLGQAPWLLIIPSITIIGREITMSALREWAASQSSKLLEAVGVNNLGKWKTATQMIALTILLATRDCSGGGAAILVYLGVVLLYIAAGLAIWSFVIYMTKISKVLLR